MTEDEARTTRDSSRSNLKMREWAADLQNWLNRYTGENCHLDIFCQADAKFGAAINQAIAPVVKAEIARLVAEADAMPLIPEKTAKPYEPML